MSDLLQMGRLARKKPGKTGPWPKQPMKQAQAECVWQISATGR